MKTNQVSLRVKEILKRHFVTEVDSPPVTPASLEIVDLLTQFLEGLPCEEKEHYDNCKKGIASEDYATCDCGIATYNICAKETKQYRDKVLKQIK